MVLIIAEPKRTVRNDLNLNNYRNDGYIVSIGHKLKLKIFLFF